MEDIVLCPTVTYQVYNNKIHNYYIAKALLHLVPSGLLDENDPVLFFQLSANYIIIEQEFNIMISTQ